MKGRNQDCPCGSKTKLKKCCLAKTNSAQEEERFSRYQKEDPVERETSWWRKDYWPGVEYRLLSEADKARSEQSAELLTRIQTAVSNVSVDAASGQS